MTACRTGLALSILAATLACGAPAQTPPEEPTAGFDHPDMTGFDPEIAAAMQAARRRLEAALAALAADDPDSRQLATHWGELGMIYQAHDLDEAAAAAYMKAEQLDATDARWSYYLAVVRQHGGESGSAIAALDRVLERRPDYIPARIRLARLALERGAIDLAGELFASVANAAPDQPAAWFGLGRTAAAAGDHGAAVEHFERALELAPEATQIHYPLGLAYRELGQIDRATEWLERRGEVPVPLADPLLEALATIGSGPRLRLARGSALMIQGRFDEAIVLLREALVETPDDPDLRSNLGLALLQEGQTEAAVVELERALELQPVDSVAQMNLAVARARLGDDETAVRLYRELLEREPDGARARYQLANALYRLGDYAAAAREYAHAVRLEPANPGARYGECVALIQAGETPTATRRLEAGLGALPGNRLLLHALVRILAAAPDSRLRDGKRAMALADQLAQGPLELDLLPTMAMVAAENGMFDEAIQIQDRALSAHREAGRVRQLAELEAQQQSYRRGEAWRRPWFEFDPLLTPPSPAATPG